MEFRSGPGKEWRRVGEDVTNKGGAWETHTQILATGFREIADWEAAIPPKVVVRKKVTWRGDSGTESGLRSQNWKNQAKIPITEEP